VLPAPHFRRWSRVRVVREFIDGVTAAATGAIAGAAWVLGRRALVDGGAVSIALTAMVVLWRFRKVPEPVVILMAGMVGLALR
jgi:chromate transporter